jgi:hypothetical protein
MVPQALMDRIGPAVLVGLIPVDFAVMDRRFRALSSDDKDAVSVCCVSTRLPPNATHLRVVPGKVVLPRLVTWFRMDETARSCLYARASN